MPEELTAKETKKGRPPSSLEKKLNDLASKYLSRIPFIQKVFFIDHMRTMLHAGLSLIESLDILGKEIENAKFKLIVNDIKAEVEKGNPLSEVLSNHPKVFPNMYVKMVEAGETSGRLEEALSQVVIQMQKTLKLTSAIRGAMIYPAIIIFAMASIGVMMVTVVLPKMMVMFEEFDTELPLATRIMIAITKFMSNPSNLLIIIAVLVGTITGFIYLLKKSPSFKKSVHKINLRLPIFGSVIKKINLARFSLTLSSLLKSTIPIIDATNITAATCGNVLYQNFLRAATDKIRSGTPLSEILRGDDYLFPPMVTEMLMVGERTGEIEHLLSELSDFYSNEVDKTLKNFTTIIEPIIILLLGVAVAGLAIAVIMPMYSLVQNF